MARLAAASSGLGLDTAIALVLGLGVGSGAAWRPLVGPGARWAARTMLRVGVALLGARLTLGAVVEGGAAALLGVAVVVVAGLSLGWWGAKRLAVPGRLGWLIAAGMAICGNSAIMALAPILRAEDRETTYAVGTITLFGLIGVLLLPVAGVVLGLSDGVLGTWAGLSINDTAQVVAAGYAYSPPAGDVATVVKLTRNLAIAPVLIGAALVMGRGRAVSAPGAFARAVPWFVLGFVVLAGLRSLGLLDLPAPGGQTIADLLSASASWLILIALAGVGASADLRAVVGVGPRPLALGIGLWVVILALGFLATTVLGEAVYDGLQ